MKEDQNILLLLAKLWAEFGKQKKNVRTLTEDQKANLQEGWSWTLNLAPEAWKTAITADWHNTRAEHVRKTNLLLDYIGPNATR